VGLTWFSQHFYIAVKSNRFAAGGAAAVLGAGGAAAGGGAAFGGAAGSPLPLALARTPSSASLRHRGGKEGGALVRWDGGGGWRDAVRSPPLEAAWSRISGAIVQEFVYDAW